MGFALQKGGRRGSALGFGLRGAGTSRSPHAGLSLACTAVAPRCWCRSAWAPWLWEVGFWGKKPQIFSNVVFEGRLTPPGTVIRQSCTPGVLQGSRGPSPVRMVGVPLLGSPGGPHGSGAEQLCHALSLQEAGTHNDKREKKQPTALLFIPFFTPGVTRGGCRAAGRRRRQEKEPRHPAAPLGTESQPQPRLTRLG